MAKEIKMRARARRPLPPIYELAAFSVFGFCVAHGLSRSLFYRLLRSGAGPRVMKCGRRTLISVEAAQRWRRARERVAAGSRLAIIDNGHRIRKPRAQHRIGNGGSGGHARRH
jgi:hypothetical protein